tara:strand:- start:134 stop:460 length:327 start_codon:yes stop_codon:yes gene_type:complete
MELDRKLIRKMILKEMKLLNEGEMQYHDTAGKKAAADNLTSAALFFDAERKKMAPGTNEFCREMMALCGHLSTSVRDGYDIDATFGDEIIKQGEKIKAILIKNKEYLD